MPGFGRSYFGRGPFGRSDAGRDLIIELFPETYFDETLDGAEDGLRDNVNDPLVQVLKTYAHAINARRAEIDSLKDIIDYDAAPTEFLRLLGNTLGLQIDKNDPEFIQRTFVSTASQWLQIKGSNKGYQYRGLASGFSVKVQNFWRVHESLASTIPARYQFYYRPKNYDEPVYITGNLTNGSAVITGVNTSALGSWIVGKEVFASGLPLTTPKVVSYTANTITLDQVAGQTSTGVKVGIHRVNSLLYSDSPPGTHRGSALYLYGDAGQNYMTATKLTTTSNSGTFSIEFRFVANSVTSNQIIFQNGISSTNRMAIKITNGTLKIGKSAVSNFSVITAPIVAKKEYYVVYSVSSGVAKLYLNGVETGTTATEAFSFGSDTTKMWVGVSSDATQFFDGRIWDLRVSNRALTASEALSRLYSVYATDSALKNSWSLNKTTVDSVGANNGTLNGGDSYDVVVQIGASSEAQDDVTYITYPETSTYSKSSYVGLIFQVKKYYEGVEYNTLLDLVIEKIRDVTAIHHEPTPPVYLVELDIDLNSTLKSTMKMAQPGSAFDYYGGGEVSYIDVPTANRFDQLPADRPDLYLDRSGLTVTIKKLEESEAVILYSAVLSATIQSGPSDTIAAENNIGISLDTEVTGVASVSVGMLMDLEQADSGNTDGGLGVTIT